MIQLMHPVSLQANGLLHGNNATFMCARGRKDSMLERRYSIIPSRYLRVRDVG